MLEQIDLEESCDSTCNCQTLTPSSIHSEKWDLIRVVKAQHDGPSNQWWDVFCIEDDRHHEISNGPHESLEAFADRLIEMGWCVYSADMGTAICSACSNFSPELSEEEEREDFKVYEARKGNL